MGSDGRDDAAPHGGQAARALGPPPPGHGIISDLCVVVMRVGVDVR
jgi:hypothetical protein